MKKLFASPETRYNLALYVHNKPDIDLIVKEKAHPTQWPQSIELRSYDGLVVGCYILWASSLLYGNMYEFDTLFKDRTPATTQKEFLERLIKPYMNNQHETQGKKDANGASLFYSPYIITTLPTFDHITNNVVEKLLQQKLASQTPTSGTEEKKAKDIVATTVSTSQSTNQVTEQTQREQIKNELIANLTAKIEGVEGAGLKKLNIPPLNDFDHFIIERIEDDNKRFEIEDNKLYEREADALREITLYYDCCLSGAVDSPPDHYL